MQSLLELPNDMLRLLLHYTGNTLFPMLGATDDAIVVQGLLALPCVQHLRDTNIRGTARRNLGMPLFRVYRAHLLDTLRLASTCTRLYNDILLPCWKGIYRVFNTLRHCVEHGPGNVVKPIEGEQRLAETYRAAALLSAWYDTTRLTQTIDFTLLVRCKETVPPPVGVDARPGAPSPRSSNREILFQPAYSDRFNDVTGPLTWRDPASMDAKEAWDYAERRVRRFWRFQPAAVHAPLLVVDGERRLLVTAIGGDPARLSLPADATSHDPDMIHRLLRRREDFGEYAAMLQATIAKARAKRNRVEAQKEAHEKRRRLDETCMASLPRFDLNL